MSQAELCDLLGVDAHLAASIVAFAKLPSQSKAQTEIPESPPLQDQDHGCADDGLFWSPADEAEEPSRSRAQQQARKP